MLSLNSFATGYFILYCRSEIEDEMTINIIDNAIRTEWKIKSRSDFFESLIDFFPQLDSRDQRLIRSQINDRRLEYFEIPHYENFDDEFSEPKMLLVFQEKRTFVDIINPDHKDEIMEAINKVIDSESVFVKARKLTASEWKKRLEYLENLKSEADDDDIFNDIENVIDDENSFDGEFDIEDEFSISCDESGVLDRTGFKLIAKEPAVTWLNEVEQQHVNSQYHVKWSLELVNSEAHVFLVPIALELAPENEQQRIWSKLRIRAFNCFLDSYYMDEKLWPEVTQEKFDEWFSIEKFGLIVDISDDL